MKVLDSVDIEKNNMNIVSQKTIKKYTLSAEDNTITKQIIQDYLSPEAPFEIAAKTLKSTKSFKNIAITMCTLQNLEELAIGFLFTEGIIRSLDDIHSTELQSSRIEVILKTGFQSKLDKINRHFFTSSSCGICSKNNIENLKTDSIYLPWTSTLVINPRSLFDLRKYFEKNQQIFEKTGGIHSTILLDKKMQKLAGFEDIGRHNSMDKIIGYSLMNHLVPLQNNLMLVSGRISFELVQKAIMAGTPIICALGAPSDLAIEEAEAQNVTLIGFAKNKSFNVYSGFNRLEQ